MEEHPVPAAWGNVLRRYRQWLHLSRRELALRAGLSPVFLGEIERAEKEASSESITRIAHALDAPVSELFLRVGAALIEQPNLAPRSQTTLPRMVREDDTEYLSAVSAADEETAFDLYKLARRLRADQQVSLLVVARSLLSLREEKGDKH